MMSGKVVLCADLLFFPLQNPKKRRQWYYTAADGTRQNAGFVKEFDQITFATVRVSASLATVACNPYAVTIVAKMTSALTYRLTKSLFHKNRAMHINSFAQCAAKILDLKTLMVKKHIFILNCLSISQIANML